jgi:MinD-like ATPase involved in chromosome partitioning or flagellar assembly
MSGYGCVHISMNSTRRETIATEKSFLNSVYDIVQLIVKTELRNTSKHLILNYIKEAEEVSLPDKAREAITRYTNEEVPSLEEIREKSKVAQLKELDHLILKMEYQADQLSKHEH